jgi:predicted dienelactone hydrolase/ABC-type amino acid transport substrate-binding protein
MRWPNQGFCKLLSGLASTCLLAALGSLSEAILPQAAQSAEEIRITVGGPALVFPLKIDSLESFAATGELPDDLRLYARFIDERTLAMLRQGLQRRIPLNVVQTDQMTYSPLGRDILYNLGKVIRVHPEVNGLHGLRGALILAAANAGPEGWTMLDVLRQFPTESIDINLSDLLELRRLLTTYVSYNQAVVRAIKMEAAQEAATQREVTLNTDLSQPGPYHFLQQTITVRNPALRQTQVGLSVNYDFDVDMYLPQGLNQPAPIVIISHGFGDVKESFTFMAEHLASHGFVVLIPDHVGSDLAYRQKFLEGRLNTLLSPMEFLNRPQEISFLIDELERLVKTSPEWAAQLNVDQIGVAGDSFGGLTVLSLAGAEINHARLMETCNENNLIFNFVQYLQCRARFLPAEIYNLQDPRIKAFIAAHPFGATLYGPEGYSQITAPLLVVSGSNDILSPVVTEQIHPFIWLQSQPKYLALLTVGTHFSSKLGRVGAGGLFQALVGQHREIGAQYFKALQVAFWRIYLQGQEDYLPYLSARYGQTVSTGQPMTLDIIQSLTPDQLVAAYGQQPPVPVVPSPLTATVPARADSVLDEVRQTGVLKVALRRDAAPFGYINAENQWDGYCGDFAIALRDYLSNTLKTDVRIEMVELLSTLDNRFSLVQTNAVHLECGPNSIRQDIEGVTFSSPIFVAGTRFLVQGNNATAVNPNTPLNNVRLGVLPETTTEQFVRDRYPQAEIVAFEGPEGRIDGVRAVSEGRIAAFVTDDILATGEIQRENLNPSNYALLPELPLTCEFYGLILPAGDTHWRNTVNQFLASDREQAVSDQWFSELEDQQLRYLDYCLNR